MFRWLSAGVIPRTPTDSRSSIVVDKDSRWVSTDAAVAQLGPKRVTDTPPRSGDAEFVFNGAVRSSAGDDTRLTVIAGGDLGYA